MNKLVLASLLAACAAMDSNLAYAGSPTVFDVKADYSAAGDGITDDTAAIQSAINAAVAASGGIVYFPVGTYNTTATLTIPKETNFNIELRGAHRRGTTIALAGSQTIGIRWGSSSLDTFVDDGGPATSAQQTLYGKISNITIAANVSAASTTVVKVVEAQSFVMEDVGLEGATNGIGLLVQGSDTSACTESGLPCSGKTNNTPPHAWRGNYKGLVIATCKYGIKIVNGDENDFYHATVSAVTYGVWIQQGRNNRFFGSLIGGSGTGSGVFLDATSTGPVDQTSFYGLVSESWTYGINVNSLHVTGSTFYNYNSSLNTNSYTVPAGSSGTLISTFNQEYMFGRQSASRHTAISWSSTVSIDVRAGNYYSITITGNTAWTLALTNPVEGQQIVLEFVSAVGGAVRRPTTTGITLCYPELIMPATGDRRMIGLEYDGVSWREMWRSTSDQP